MPVKIPYNRTGWRGGGSCFYKKYCKAISKVLEKKLFSNKYPDLSISTYCISVTNHTFESIT